MFGILATRYLLGSSVFCAWRLAFSWYLLFCCVLLRCSWLGACRETSSYGDQHQDASYKDYRLLPSQTGSVETVLNILSMPLFEAVRITRKLEYFLCNSIYHWISFFLSRVFLYRLIPSSFLHSFLSVSPCTSFCKICFLFLSLLALSSFKRQVNVRLFRV